MMKERLIGLFLLLVGCLLTYVCIYQPLEAAKAGEAKVTVYLKGSIAAPFGLLGLVMLVFGSKCNGVLGTREKPTPVAYALTFGLAILGLGIYIWLRSELQSYGYDFSGKF